MIAFGASEAIGSFVGGRISDSIGRTPVFIFCSACSAAGVLVAALSPPGVHDGTTPVSWMYFFAFFLLGLGDSGFNTQVQAAVGHYHPDKSQAAFAFYRGWLSVWAAVGKERAWAGFFFPSSRIHPRRRRLKDPLQANG